MPQLLTKITGNKFMNRTLWEPSLLVYDEYIIYRRRHWFVLKEITISYKQIAQVNISIGILFAELEIVITGNDTRTVRIKFSKIKDTKKAKKIIDHKVHLVQYQDEKLNDNNQMRNAERSMARLKELLEKGKINKKEYDKKRKEIMLTLIS